MADKLTATSYEPDLLRKMGQAVDEVLRRHPNLAPDLVAKRILRAARLGISDRAELVECGRGTGIIKLRRFTSRQTCDPASAEKPRSRTN